MEFNCLYYFQSKVAKSTVHNFKVKEGKEADIFGMFNSFTGKYHCPRCDKTYGSKSGLRQHYQGHVGIFSFWCEQCSKGYSTKSHYEDHMAKHEGRTFHCDLCDKVFRSRRGFQRHLVQHTEG